MRFSRGLLFVAFLLLLSSVSHAAAPSATTPLDSWVYPALDKLSGLGLIQTAPQGSRPYTRNEIARQVNEGLASLSHEKMVSIGRVGRELLFRLERNYRSELRELQRPDHASRGYLGPVREFSARYTYQEGHTVATASATAGANVVAAQFPLNYNNDGIPSSELHNAQLTWSADARVSDLLLVSLRPQLNGYDDGYSESFSDLSLRNGRVAIQLGGFELSLGRQSLWWGPGRHGALVLSNNAQPFDMLRITNPAPLRLPWFLKSLGIFKLDLFWSRMEAERVVPNPYFAGIRFELQPSSWFTLGGSRGIMFGGEGRPDIKTSEFVTILSGKNLSGGADTSNSVAAIDFRLKLPFLRGMEFYAEIGGEDEAGGWIANSAGIAGLYFPQLDSSGRLSLRLEYADLSHIDDNSPMWYRHGIYRSGYTYEGKLLGHHAGGGSQDYFAELVCFFPGHSRVTLGIDYEDRGSDQAVAEQHRQVMISLSKTFGYYFDLSLDGKINKINNLEFIDGADRNDWQVGISSQFLF